MIEANKSCLFSSMLNKRKTANLPATIKATQNAKAVKTSKLTKLPKIKMSNNMIGTERKNNEVVKMESSKQVTQLLF
jgi:hypothetical protein